MNLFTILPYNNCLTTVLLIEICSSKVVAIILLLGLEIRLFSRGCTLRIPPYPPPRTLTFAHHSPKFVNQLSTNEPCRDGKGFGTPKNTLSESGCVKICSEIKPDYMSIKRIQNMLLVEAKSTITGSYFLQKLLSFEDTLVHTSFFGRASIRNALCAI